jgi:cysteine-rich protein 2-binding protein
MNSHFRSHQKLTRMPDMVLTDTLSKPPSPSPSKTVQVLEDPQKLNDIQQTPYANSFASRLYGSPRCHNTVSKAEPWLSPWNGRKLRPYIRRDFESKPPGMRLLHEIRLAAGKPQKRRQELNIPNEQLDSESIDYVYFQKDHLEPVNQVLRRAFWDEIDVSENLLSPEYSIVALYKRYVVGCAFMTPEAYVTYITVVPGWENAGIGQYVYLLIFQISVLISNESTLDFCYTIFSKQLLVKISPSMYQRIAPPWYVLKIY